MKNKNYFAVFIFKVLIFSFIHIFFVSKCIASDLKEADSLLQILAFKKGTEKADLLYAIADKYKIHSFENSYRYANQSFILSSSLNYIKGQANAMYLLGVIHYLKNDYNKALYYWEKTVKYRNADNDQIGAANSLSNIGLVFMNTGEYDKSIEYFTKSLRIHTQLNNKKGMAKPIENLGVAHFKKGDYEKAIEFYQKSLKIEEELNNKLGVSQSLSSIAGVFLKMNNYTKALDYFNQSLQMKMELKDENEISITLNSIGVVYENTDNIPKAIEYYNKALSYNGQNVNKQNIANTLNNMGNIHILLKKYPEALDYFKKALIINQQIGSKEGIASCNFHFADIYNRKKDFQSALNYTLISLTVAKQIGSRDLFFKNLMLQADIYANLKDFANAYNALSSANILKDSLINETNHKQINEIETKYQTEKKKKEIAFLNQQSELNELKLKKNAKDIQFQRVVMFIVLIGFVLILFIAVLIYKQFIEKKAVNLKLEFQNKEISSKKEELEVQKNIAIQQRDQIIEQKKHITDSILYAQKIQNAILPDSDSFNKYFKDNFIIFKPKDIVSGDFYWFSKLSNEESKIVVAAIDCTGHGVPGAFMSIVAYNLLKQAINEYQLSKPSEILNSLSINLISTMQLKDNENVVMDGMDISLCVIDIDEMNLTYAGAHNPVYIVRENEFIELKADTHSIGEVFTSDFTGFADKEVFLEENDCIYLFSDGYIDQFGGPNRKKFMSRQFKKLLTDIHNMNFTKQKEFIENRFNEWKANIDQYDDVMIIGLKIIQNKEVMQENILLGYKGKYHFETIEKLINQAKTTIDKIEIKNVIKKKIINVLIECLENIHKYAIIDNENADILPQIFLIHSDDKFFIKTKNLIAKEQTEILGNHLNLVNSQEKEGLKKMYEEIIDNGNISEKGGAGLGFIDMAIKSGNKIIYNFAEYNKETVFFELTVVINNIT